MASAVVSLCADPRLNHEVVRLQVANRLEELGLRAERIFLTNEPGANIGSSFRSTLHLLLRGGDAIVLLALLYHDDCVAAAYGLRAERSANLAEIERLKGVLEIEALVLSGDIVTETSTVRWRDQPARSRAASGFRMPRLYGQ